MHIRKANQSDIEIIVDINIQTWLTTYAGIIDNAILERFAQSRQKRIDRDLEYYESGDYKLKHEERALAMVDNQEVGFITYGPCRQAKAYQLKDTGEIYAIYVLADYQKSGVGKALLDYAFNELKRQYNYTAVLIWALKDNPFRRFYEKNGGQKAFHKPLLLAHKTYTEVGYLFNL